MSDLFEFVKAHESWQLPRYQDGRISLDVTEDDYNKLRELLLAAQGGDPVAWISVVNCIGPEYGRERYSKLPIQSLNPGYYKYIPLYTHPTVDDAWEPSPVDYDREIHSNPDAQAWADFFVATFPKLESKRDLMLAWFANAMMAMHDHIKSKSVEMENMSNELKPCPFCGSEPLIQEHTAHKHVTAGWQDHPGSCTIEYVVCEAGLIADTHAVMPFEKLS